MTREEAIEYNKNLREYMRITDKECEYKFLEENYIALDMAIKALEQEPCEMPLPKPYKPTDFEKEWLPEWLPQYEGKWVAESEDKK